MSIAQYLNIATSVGLTRRDALLMEISTVYEMFNARHEKGSKEKWQNEL